MVIVVGDEDGWFTTTTFYNYIHKVNLYLVCIYGMVQLSLHLFTATCTLCLFCYISGLKVSIPEMSVIHTCT